MKLKEERHMKLKTGDILVVAAVAVIALGLLGIRAIPSAAGGRMLRVELNGRLLEEISFDENTDTTITVALPEGEAAVEIRGGRVRVLPMPREICPLGICSSIGWVERSGDAIVCLPNRLVLTVMGGATDEAWDSLDGVTK